MTKERYDAEDDSHDDDGDGDALIFEVNVLVLEEDVLVTDQFRRNLNIHPAFAWGGRPHRRFISVRERG